MDYGGHKVYHLAMQLLSRDRCVPLIVVNMEEFVTLSKENGVREATRRVCFDWFSHLYLVSPNLGSPILVLTHMDKLEKEQRQQWRKELLETANVIRCEMLEEEDLSSSGNLVHVQHLSNRDKPLFDPEEIYEFTNNSSETANIEKLKQNLDERCKEFVATLPRIWEQVAEYVEQQNEMPFVIAKEVQKKFPNDDPLIILRYMHNSGRLLWFENKTAVNISQ